MTYGKLEERNGKFRFRISFFRYELLTSNYNSVAIVGLIYLPIK